MLKTFCVGLVVIVFCLPGFPADQSTGSSETGGGFDYFDNNWNVVGLKDYVHGSRITPDNQLLLSGNTRLQIRIGPGRRR